MSGTADRTAVVGAGGNAERRPDRRVGKTRRALKDALTDLTLERGYEAVTVADIIDRADVGRSTFYAHFQDKDDLLLATLADLQMPGPDPSGRTASDEAFGWTLELFRRFETGKRLFRALASSQAGALGRQEMIRWLDDLARAELRRIQAPRKLDSPRLEVVVRFLAGTFIGFMEWWGREENEDLPAETVDRAFRSLVLPGVAHVLDLDIEIPSAL
jgi:AcrR family transcriptional regulator